MMAKNPIKEEAMKRKMGAVALMLFGVFVTLSSAFAQSIAIPEVPSQNFTITQPAIRLLLNGFRPTSDYIVGVKREENNLHVGSIEAGDFITSSRVAPPRGRRFEGLNAIPKEKLQITNGSISLSGLDALQGNLYVLLTLPQDTSITLLVNDAIVYAGTPVKGTIIHGGKEVAQSFDGRHQLIARLLHPEIDQHQPELTGSPNGLVASQEALAKHLVSFNMPANHPQFISDDRTVVHLAVKIDPSGKVAAVRTFSGIEPFISETVSAVKKAQFTPFTSRGAPVPIEGDIVIVFQKDGRVAGSLR